MRVPVCETESKTEIVGRVGMAATFVALLFCFFLLWIKAGCAPLTAWELER